MNLKYFFRESPAALKQYTGHHVVRYLCILVVMI